MFDIGYWSEIYVGMKVICGCGDVGVLDVWI